MLQFQSFPGYQQWPGGVKKSKWPIYGRAETRRTSCQSDQRKLKYGQQADQRTLKHGNRNRQYCQQADQRKLKHGNRKRPIFSQTNCNLISALITTFTSYLKRRLWKRQLSRTNVYNYQDNTSIFQRVTNEPAIGVSRKPNKMPVKNRDNYEAMVVKSIIFKMKSLI